MAKVNFDELGVSIVDLAGGAGNILSVTNCATRVRLRLVDDSRAKLEDIKKLKGVMGALFNIGQLQIIIGPDVVEVVAAVNKAYKAGGGKADTSLAAGSSNVPDEEEGKRRVLWRDWAGCSSISFPLRFARSSPLFWRRYDQGIYRID